MELNNITVEKSGEFIKINSTDNFDEIFKKIIKNRKFYESNGIQKKEFLLSFRFNEKDLWDKATVLKIRNFLDNLHNKKIKFVLSRPFPYCLRIKINDRIPKNCFECLELFTLDTNNMIKSCDTLSVIGSKLEYMKDRNQIFEYFKTFNDELIRSKYCENCIYFIRKRCNGLCI